MSESRSEMKRKNVLQGKDMNEGVYEKTNRERAQMIVDKISTRPSGQLQTSLIEDALDAAEERGLKMAYATNGMHTTFGQIPRAEIEKVESALLDGVGESYARDHEAYEQAISIVQGWLR